MSFALIILELAYLIIRQKKQFTFAGSHERKKTDSINFVQSSLKSHPLWVTLYFLILK